MSYQLMKNLTFVLLFLCGVATLANTAKLTGTVEQIDKARRTITLVIPPGPGRELHASAEMLQNLHIGERVEVEVSDDKITAMRKKFSLP
jgi:hypothetical protein